MASDHVALNIVLALEINNADETKIKGEQQKMQVYNWDWGKLKEYQEQYLKEECRHLKDDLIVGIANKDGCVEKVANAFNTLIKTAIAPTFKLRTMGTKSTFPKNPWYREQCKAARKCLREIRSRTDLTIPKQWENFKQAESEYKRVVQCEKRKYKEKQCLEFENLCSKNPDKYCTNQI